MTLIRMRSIKCDMIGTHNLCRPRYIQMEHCEKKTLRDLIMSGLARDHVMTSSLSSISSRRCMQGKVTTLFRQIVEGLAHIHQQRIIHRDLKACMNTARCLYLVSSLCSPRICFLTRTKTSRSVTLVCIKSTKLLSINHVAECALVTGLSTLELANSDVNVSMLPSPDGSRSPNTGTLHAHHP